MSGYTYHANRVNDVVSVTLHDGRKGWPTAAEVAKRFVRRGEAGAARSHREGSTFTFLIQRPAIDLLTWARELTDASNDPDVDSDNFMTEARAFLEEFVAQEES